MKLTIIGSMAFYEKYPELKKQLEKIGHVVKIPRQMNFMKNQEK